MSLTKRMLRSSRILLTGCQSFKSCTKQQKAAIACKHLIRSEEGPHIRTTKYSVSLSPFGDQLESGYVSIRIKSLAQLQAAIRCVLLALKDLHAARFAHTDICGQMW